MANSPCDPRKWNRHKGVVLRSKQSCTRVGGVFHFVRESHDKSGLTSNVVAKKAVLLKEALPNEL
eukprot:4776683-Amphidinium_carterae.1